MKNKQDNPIDDLFRSQFEDFENAVPTNSWEQISERMAEQSFDQIVKNKIQDIEKTPSPQVWMNVKKEIPYSLFLRNYLHKLSKIAAILIIGMLVYVLINKEQQNKNITTITTIESNIEITTPNAEAIVEEPSYVFEITPKKKKKSTTSISKALAAEAEEDIEELLADILEDDDGLLEMINNKKIAKALAPLQNLPIEGIVDNFSSKKDSNNYYAEEEHYFNEEEDLQIWVPIRYIEDHEIEAMLDTYDAVAAER